MPEIGSGNETNERPWRILVVENDPAILADHIHNLGSWGYEVCVARGIGQQLIQDALRLSREHGCHLAIVDMRLVDDDDVSDESGFDLVERLGSVPSFIVSGHGSLQKASQAISRSGAKQFIGKEEGPKRLKIAIEDFLEELCRSSQYPGEIRWAPGWKPERIASELFDGTDVSGIQEVTCVVRRLFNSAPFAQARVLRFSAVTGASRTLHTDHFHHSAVFKVNADDLQPAFVKLASIQQVLAEYNNYMNHIWQHLPAARHSQLLQHELVGFTGGIRYGFLGTDTSWLKTLADRLAEMSDHEINHCLDIFFSEVWASKFQQRKLCDKSLFAAYAEVWGRKWLARLQPFSRVSEVSYEIPGLSPMWLPNPIAWLLNRIDSGNEFAEDITASIVHYTAVTHGDLHCQNIFVDGHGEPWLIDYERTGEGPILRDFVELEIDLILQYLSVYAVDWPSVFRFFLSILRPDQVNIISDSGYVAENLTKIDSVISNLRLSAHSNAQARDAREYYWGLLLDITLIISPLVEGESSLQSASSIRIRTSDPLRMHSGNGVSTDDKLELLFLLGGLICYRLDYWDRPWPPKAWGA